jgi:hypothetical protein
LDREGREKARKSAKARKRETRNNAKARKRESAKGFARGVEALAGWLVSKTSG